MKSKTLQAINPKYQTLVNRSVSWMNKYNEYNRLRNIADGEGDDKAAQKWEKKCDYAFNKYLEYADELTKRELDRIDKFIYE